MSNRAERCRLAKTIITRISDLYSMGVIDSETKNALAEKVKIGMSDGYDELFNFVSQSQIKEVADITDIILFE